MVLFGILAFDTKLNVTLTAVDIQTHSTLLVIKRVTTGALNIIKAYEHFGHSLTCASPFFRVVTLNGLVAFFLTQQASFKTTFAYVGYLSCILGNNEVKVTTRIATSFDLVVGVGVRLA